MRTAAKIAFAGIVVSLTLSMATPLARAEDEPQSQAIHLRIPDCNERSAISVKYYFGRGASGGSGGFRAVAKNREYTIELLHDGQRASDLGATIYCLGYQTVLLRHNPTADGPNQTVVIRLERLGTVKLRGHVLPPGLKVTADLRIEAAYYPWWEHEFSGLPDYALGPFLVDSTPLSADGTFELTVPDFAHDPVVSSYANNAVLKVTARNQRTGNPAYHLELAQRSDRAAEVSIAAEYPELEVYALPPR